MNIKIVCMVSGVALLLAIPTGWPYDFYILLRWLICISAIITASGFYKSKLSGWAFLFGLMGLLFNPIFPFYLKKNTWVMIDLVSSVLFFLAAYSTKKNKYG